MPLSAGGRNRIAAHPQKPRRRLVVLPGRNRLMPQRRSLSELLDPDIPGMRKRSYGDSRQELFQKIKPRSGIWKATKATNTAWYSSRLPTARELNWVERMQRLGTVTGKSGRCRLNVLFSRAKMRVKAFSSRTSGNIVRTSGVQSCG